MRICCVIGTIAAVALWLVAPAHAQTYSNPLSTPAFPPAGSWFTAGPADPVVVEFEGTYYVYPTGNGFVYKAMSSEDLVHWTGDATVFSMPPDSPWKTWSLWAPEIERINGRFYLYYTAGLGDIQDQRIGVADADTPLGPFVDRSFTSPLITQAAIDAECFQDDDGRLYLYYVRNRQDPFLSIWVRRLLDPLTLNPNSTPQLCIAPTLNWEASVAEGPTVIKRNGRYYMFYSAWGANSPNYVVAVAVADHPLGPWTRQPEPYNPVFKRNDAIGLWGPGHGHNVVGPDGISDWYVYHHKINPNENFDRHLALDRVVPIARHASTHLRFTSSGGTTRPTPSPRLAFDYSSFDDNQLPASFSPVAGVWSATDRKLSAPADGALRINRPLASNSLQDFQWQWWLRAADGFVPSAESTIEFSFLTVKLGQPYRVGWQILPGPGIIRFVEIEDSTGAAVVHLSATPSPPIDWSHHSRRITLSKAGALWRFSIDDASLVSVQHNALLGPEAWVRTTAAPGWLDGYRQTVVFADDFECSACTSDRWAFLSGLWNYIPPAGGDDGHLRQSDQTPGARMAICTSLSPGEFDLSADFLPVAQSTATGAIPRYGLVHNYVGPGDYAMVLIDDASATVTTNAVIDGMLQEWAGASAPMPPTFAVADYRNLTVTTNVEAAEFVYTLNGLEVLRRAYSGLPVRGQAGLITESSDVRIDNFRFSDSTARPRIILDPPAIHRTLFIADDLPNESFSIANGGGDGLSYQISEDADWLEVSPHSGDSTGEADVITIAYDLTGLLAATHTAHITVASPEALNNPQTLTLQIAIETVPPDFDGDGDVDMEDFSFMQICFTTLTTPPLMPPDCGAADLTGDGRINFNDIAVLQGCLSGSHMFAEEGCEGSSR